MVISEKNYKKGSISQLHNTGVLLDP